MISALNEAGITIECPESKIKLSLPDDGDTYSKDQVQGWFDTLQELGIIPVDESVFVQQDLASVTQLVFEKPYILDPTRTEITTRTGLNDWLTY